MESTDQPDYNDHQEREGTENLAPDDALTGADTPTDEEKKWSAITHISTLSGFIIPFGNLIAPFIIYFLKKDEMPMVMDQAKEVLNFQISISIYLILSAFLILLIIGLPLLIAVLLFDVIMTVIATIKASEGNKYRYPLTIRLVK